MNRTISQHHTKYFLLLLTVLSTTLAYAQNNSTPYISPHTPLDSLTRSHTQLIQKLTNNFNQLQAKEQTNKNPQSYSLSTQYKEIKQEHLSIQNQLIATQEMLDKKRKTRLWIQGTGVAIALPVAIVNAFLFSFLVSYIAIQ